MRVIRTETLMVRIRRGVSRLVSDDAAGGEGGRRALLQPHLTIRDVMQTELATVRPEGLLAPAVRMMIDQDVSSLPVVDAGGRIVGALNQKDVLRVFYDADATTVASVMTTDPIVIPVDAPLIDVVDQLMSSDFRRVHIQEDGRLVGVIVRTHLMPAVLGAIEEEAERRSSTPRT